MSVEFRGYPFDPRVITLPDQDKGITEEEVESIVARLIQQNVTQTVDYKDSVRAATDGPVILSGAQTIDGVNVRVGDRVLVKDQSDGRENGIYVVMDEEWRRSSDADEDAEVTSGMKCYVSEGDRSAGRSASERSDSRCGRRR